MNCTDAFLTLIETGLISSVCEEEFERRISFCSICPKRQGGGKELKCSECSCCMNAKAKAKRHALHKLGLKDVDCPLGFWKYNFEEFKNNIDNGKI